MLRIAVVVVVVVVALQFLSTVSGSGDEQSEREEEEEGEEGERTASPPLTLQPDVKPSLGDRGSRGHVGLKSKKCQSRGKCGRETESGAVTSGSRNCFCDRLCSYYDDCCRDYQSEDGGDQFAHLPRGVATCQRVNDIETGGSVEIFKTSRCPKSFADVSIRRLCEAEVGPATSDRFLLLPVTGNTSLVLYRNIYCAACAGERHPVFWLAKLRCGRGLLRLGGPPSGTPVDLKAIVRAACPVDFAPVREWGGGPGGPRRCTVHIGRCDRDWLDESVRLKCRSTTDYVYAGNRAFRNKYCALCNYVNETYLRCDDVRPQSKADVTSGGYFEETAASVVTLDFNRGRAVVMETVTGIDYVTERRIDFPACSPEGGVYDPFADVCRNITCLPEIGFPAENCFRQPETAELNDRAAQESVTSNDEGQVEEQDKDHDVKIGHDGDIFNSTSVATMTTTGVAMTTTVETDFVPMSARFVLFRMCALQRLFALIGTLLCILCLCVFVVMYVIYESMRTDPANRYVVCLSLCLLVAHLLFVFVVLPTEQFIGQLPCFCLSIVIQYAYVTAFFWLNVLSIDVFKRLTTAADQPTADPATMPGHCVCFTLFSLFAWMVPAVPMAASTAIAVLRVDGWEQLYGGGGGTEGCFVLGMSQLLLFLVPVALVVITNFAMYVIVTCRICLEPLPIGTDKDRFRQTLKDRKLFVTCVQLTVVMTTTWGLAFVAHLTGLTFVWNLFILFDMMQGVSVAAAFAFKVKVWHQFNGRSRSVTITKTSSTAEKNRRNRSCSSEDGMDTAIEPFVDALTEGGEEDPVVHSNAPHDTIFRETSI